MTANTLLVRDSLVKWVATPGLLMVLAVALVPPALTGAWVFTHQDDIDVGSLAWDPEVPDNDQLVNISVGLTNRFDTDVGPFNVTVRIGFYQRDPNTEEITWRDTHNETVPNVTLGPNEETTVTVNWTAQAGVHQVEAYADFFNDEIPEIEERNNYRTAQMQVRYPTVRPQIENPPSTANNTTTPAAVLDARMSDVTWTPAEIFQEDNVTFTATVANDGPDDLDGASVIFQVHQLTLGGLASNVVFNDQAEDVSVPAGETRDLTFEYPNAARGFFAAFAYVDTSAVATGDNDTNNAVVQQFDVQRRLVFDEPDPKATAKDFYRQEVLLPVHFALLVPLIGLFYAGGVLQDDRSRGNLTYMLTRPVPRWRYPITRFASSYGIALVAVLVGVALTYMLLLGTPQDAPGFFWWPLGFGALVLFMYAAVFTAVGVTSEKPYLVGLLYILGWETLMMLGSRVLVNSQPVVQPWVLRFSLSEWTCQAYRGWDTEATCLTPEASLVEPMTASIVMGAIGIVSLAVAAWVATRREFVE